MFANPSASWYHRNQYRTQTACEHCGGMVRHEKWRITCDPVVQYTYSAVLEPENLSFCDRLILHALGVSWEKNRCAGACRQSEGS
jgi:hypothetical protein